MPAEVADAVAVAVGEAADVDLVDDGVAPPGTVGSGRPVGGSRLTGLDRADPGRSTVGGGVVRGWLTMLCAAISR